MASKKGYLAKQGAGHFKSWKRRWFVLQENEQQQQPLLRLAYFTNEKEAEELGTIDLINCTGLRICDIDRNSNGTLSHLLEIAVQGRTYVLAADSARAREEWFDLLDGLLKKHGILREDSGGDRPVKAGYLYKQGAINKAWRKRYFVLQNDILTYYKREKDAVVAGSVNLHSCIAITWGSSSRKFAHTLEIVTTSARTFVLAAADEADRDEWMQLLEECVPDNKGESPAGSEGGGSTAVSDAEDEDADEPAIVDSRAASVVDPDEQPVAKQGFLVKQGRIVRNSKQRWFVLKGSILLYQKTEKDKQALGYINLSLCSGLRIIDDNKKFRPFSFEVNTPDRVYYLTAATETERDEWMAVIEDGIPDEAFDDEVGCRTPTMTEV